MRYILTFAVLMPCYAVAGEYVPPTEPASLPIEEKNSLTVNSSEEISAQLTIVIGQAYQKIGQLQLENIRLKAKLENTIKPHDK